MLKKVSKSDQLTPKIQSILQLRPNSTNSQKSSRRETQNRTQTTIQTNKNQAEIEFEKKIDQLEIFKQKKTQNTTKTCIGSQNRL